MYTCPYCGRADFQAFNDQRTHIGEAHPGMDLNVCAVCNKRFSTRGNLVTHMLRHTAHVDHVCPVCGQQCSTKSNLTTHMKSHTGQGHSCPECDAFFPHPSALAAHLRTHSGEKPYRCDTCGTSFAKKSTLNTHMRIHTGEKPFGCSRCNKRFARADHLKKHMRLHTGEKPYLCTLCGVRFAQQASLSYHMKTSHPAAHTFNSALTGLLRQPENRFRNFTQAHSYISKLFDPNAPVNTLERCPHCGENFADLALHTAVCPWRPGPSWQ